MTVSQPGDVVTLAYQGDRRGTMSRQGPITKQWYHFSASPVNRTFQCAKSDAEYLLRRGDLALVPAAAPPPPPPPPVPSPMPAMPMPPAPRAAPVPQAQPVAQPTMRQPVALEEEPPADDLSEIKGVTRDTAGILALIGVRTFAQLSALNEDGVKRAAQLTGKSEKEAAKWVKAAKDLLGPPQPEEDDIDLSGLDRGSLGDLGADLPGDLQLADEGDQG